MDAKPDPCPEAPPMNRTKAALAIAACFCAFASAALGEEKSLGRVVIVGNVYTPDWFVHELLGLKTGDPLTYPELRLAEMHLRECGRFLVDPQNGIRPTVQMLKENNPGPVVDIVITVQERPWNACWPAGFDATGNRFVGYSRYYYRMTAILV